MLALTRKKGESIIISDNIEVVVISITSEQVKLGIEAPREIPVNRKEIHDLIVAANKEAAEKSKEHVGILKELNLGNLQKPQETQF